MSTAPRVAVIIPTYNHAGHLRAALDSVFAQTVQADEVVVVDDGSQDDPAAVAGRYPAVRLIRQHNQGLAAARNTGWRASRSDHLVFLDADDRLKPGAIASNLALLAEAPDSGLVYGAHSKIFVATGEERFPPFVEPGPDAFAGFLRGNCIGMHATVMYRRQVLERIGGFDPALRACEDYDLYLRIARLYPVACGPTVLAEYIIHDRNMSHSAGMMLRWALTALNKQKEAAQERAEWRQAIEEGRAGWTQYYADQWWASLPSLRGVGGFGQAVRQASIIHAIDASALRQAWRRRGYGPRRVVRRLLRRTGARP